VRDGIRNFDSSPEGRPDSGQGFAPLTPEEKSPRRAKENVDMKGPSPLAGLYPIKYLTQGFASLTPGYFLIAPSGLD